MSCLKPWKQCKQCKHYKQCKQDALVSLRSILESQSLSKSLSKSLLSLRYCFRFSRDLIVEFYKKHQKERCQNYVDLQKCQEWTFPLLPNSYCAVEAGFALKCFLPWVRIFETILESECCWNPLSFNWRGWIFFCRFFSHSHVLNSSIGKTNFALIWFFLAVQDSSIGDLVTH